MAQVPAAWATVPGGDCVSSEDESWLNQSGYHLSDDSDDERSDLLSRAYVQALATLKQRATGPNVAVSSAPLQSAVKDPSATTLALPAAPPTATDSAAAPIPSHSGKHTAPPSDNVSAQTDQPPHKSSDKQGVKPVMPNAHPTLPEPAAAAPMPHVNVSLSDASLVQHATSLPAATDGARPKADRQQGNMHALTLLFPQELEPEPAASEAHAASGDAADHVPAVDSAATEQQDNIKNSQASLASPAAAGQVQQAAPPSSDKAALPALAEAATAANAEAAAPAAAPEPTVAADAHTHAPTGTQAEVPAVSLGSLQYTLSMEEMALIQDNAQQYMQEHAASPSQPGPLAPAAAASSSQPQAMASAHASLTQPGPFTRAADCPPQPKAIAAVVGSVAQPDPHAPAAGSGQAGTGTAEGTVTVTGKGVSLTEDHSAVKEQVSAKVSSEDKPAQTGVDASSRWSNAASVAAALHVEPHQVQPSPAFADISQAVSCTPTGASTDIQQQQDKQRSGLGHQQQALVRHNAEPLQQNGAQQESQQPADPSAMHAPSADSSVASLPPAAATAASEPTAGAQTQEADDLAKRQADAFLAGLQLAASWQPCMPTPGNAVMSHAAVAAPLPLLSPVELPAPGSTAIQGSPSVPARADAAAAIPQGAGLVTPPKSNLVPAYSVEQMQAILSSAGLNRAAAPLQATMPEPAHAALAQITQQARSAAAAPFPALPASASSAPAPAPAPTALPASAPAASAPPAGASKAAKVSAAGPVAPAKQDKAAAVAASPVPPALHPNAKLEKAVAVTATPSSPPNKPVRATAPDLEKRSTSPVAAPKARKASGEVGRTPIVWKPIDTSRKAAALSGADTAKASRPASKSTDGKAASGRQPSPLPLPTLAASAPVRPVLAVAEVPTPAAATTSAAPGAASRAPSAAALASSAPAAVANTPSAAAAAFTQFAFSPYLFSPAEKKASKKSERKAAKAAAKKQAAAALLPGGNGSAQASSVPHSLAKQAGISTAPVTLPAMLPQQGNGTGKRKRAEAWAATEIAAPSVAQVSGLISEHSKDTEAPVLPIPRHPMVAPNLAARLPSPPANPSNPTSPPVHASYRKADPSPRPPPATTAEHSSSELPTSKKRRTLSATDAHDLGIMQQVHDYSSVPLAGATAVVPWLKNVRTLITDSRQRFSLKNVTQAIGEFAIGSVQEAEIFLGNFHDRAEQHMQINVIAGLFGVEAMQSKTSSRFHEIYRLTNLVKTPWAGILNQDTDPVVYSIVKLARLCHEQGHNKQDVSKYRMELNAVLSLGRAMVQHFRAKSGRQAPFPAGVQQRLAQLLKLGYLSVKRPKSTPPNPPLYSNPHGRPLYGPPSATLPPPPQVQPLPSAVATAALGSAAVPFIPGPAVEPVSLKLVQNQSSQPPTAVSSAPPSLPSGASLPASLAPLSLPTPAAVQAADPGASASVSGRDLAPAAPARSPIQHSRMFSSLTPPAPHPAPPGPLTAPPAHLPLLAPAVAPAPTAITSSAVTVQARPPLPADSTAALVAAVGPLFEAFVTETAAVVASPDKSLQSLVGKVTQDLAAAIAAAAMQVVETRQKQKQSAAVAVVPTPAGSPPVPWQTVADAHHPHGAVTLSRPLMSNADAVAASSALLNEPGTSKWPAVDAVAEAPMVPSSDSPVVGLRQEDSALSVSAKLVDKLRGALKSNRKSSSSDESSFQKPVEGGDQGKGSKQVTIVDAKSQQGSQVRAASNSPPSISTLGLNPAGNTKPKPAVGRQQVSKAESGFDSKADSHASDIQHRNAGKKRSSVEGPSTSQGRPAKRPRDLQAPSQASFEHGGYVVPGLDLSKYEVGSGKGTKPDAVPRQHDVKDAKVRSRPESSNSRGSKSSGRSDKGLRALDSSHGAKGKSRSPREPSRLNVGSTHQAGPITSGRHGGSALPSRLSADLASGPDLMAFDPAVNGAMCRGFGAPDFRPVGLHHGGDAPWMHPDALMLSDIMDAPDFTPHFSPGGPAN